MSVAPSFDLDTSVSPAVLTVEGDWQLATIGKLDRDLRKLPLLEVPYRLNVRALGELDTAGAFLIDRTLRASCRFNDPKLDLVGDHPYVASLLDLARGASAACEQDSRLPTTVVDALARLGKSAVRFSREGVSTLSFLGEAVVTCLKLLVQPHRIRWTSVVSVMEEAGLDALPIIAFLSFFVGMVMAFIGATILTQMGFQIFVVELVGFGVMRELGVIITGILLAGRTNSSFTAQIGSMKMRQEVDAMQTLGLRPMDVIVAPRIFAMLLMTPVLAFVATVSGVFGGMVVSWLTLDISPTLFLNRLQAVVPLTNFWVGLSKAPVFALIVAVVACRQGLKVGGDVQSLGRATTASVVHAIFLIIVADALFALFYLELGI